MYDLWKKRVLIPLWVVQLLITGLVLLLASIGLGIYREHEDDIQDEVSYRYGEDTSEDVSKIVKASVGVYIAISALTILLVIVEIILFARKRLSPVVAVVLNSITTLAWLVIFILAIVAAVTSGISALGFIFYLVITAACKGKLIYASIILHRYRKGVRARGAYTPAQAEAGGIDTAHTAYNPAGIPTAPYGYPSPAPPQNQQAGGASEYYASKGGYAAPTFQYEMQQQQQQPGGGRYA